MEWTKFVAKAIRHCMDHDFAITKTKTYLTEYLNEFGIVHKWEKHSLWIDDVEFDIGFNSKNICRRFSIGYHNLLK